MKPFVITCLVLTLYSTQSHAFPSGTSVVTVGGDNACDFNTATSSIQEAIDSGADEVRIASNATYVEKILLEKISITIRGGFLDCAAAAQNEQINIKTLINGDTGLNGPVVEISDIIGQQTPQQIRLENLELTGGFGTSAFLPGGGLNIIYSHAEIELDNLLIHNNSSVAGGGILIQYGDVNVQIHDTVIENNTATSGGGIACRGLSSFIKLSGESRVSNNTANLDSFGIGGNGGGIFLTQSCFLSVRAGDVTDGSDLGDVIRINNNHAGADGGGVFVFDGALILAQSFGTKPIFINENTSDAFGGGLSISGVFSYAELGGVYVMQNTSESSGGGANITDNGYLYVNENPAIALGCSFDNTFESMGCNYFAGNISDSSGGAIHNEGGGVKVYRTYFTENRSTFATAISTYFGGVSTVRSSVFAHNGMNGAGPGGHHDIFLMDVVGGASLTTVNSTFVDNEVVNAVFRADESGGNIIAVYTSIVHNLTDVPVLDNPAEQTNFECVLVHEAVSLLDVDTFGIVDDNPLFVDRKIGNFHLSADSPAIDFCDERPIGNSSRDIDGQNFGWDEPKTINTFGPYDLGADEFVVIDLIFRGGFESLD